MNVIKGLFFDLDGTLVDTLEANSSAYVEAVQSIGRKFTKEMYSSTYGMRLDLFLRKFYPDISVDEIEEVKLAKAKAYPNYLHLTRPNTELIDFVRTLREDHITALVTMAQKNNAMAVLEAAKIDDMFDFKITGSDVIHPKPHPDSYILALTQTGLRAEDVLAFEDSDSGIESASSAGIKVVKICMPANYEN